jgi:hypothetical protein
MESGEVILKKIFLFLPQLATVVTKFFLEEIYRAKGKKFILGGLVRVFYFLGPFFFKM